MSFIAILMFTTLSIVLGVGIYQLAKVKKELPEDESHLRPGAKLQQMDRDQGKAESANHSVRGTKKDPLEA